MFRRKFFNLVLNAAANIVSGDLGNPTPTPDAEETFEEGETMTTYNGLTFPAQPFSVESVEAWKHEFLIEAQKPARTICISRKTAHELLAEIPNQGNDPEEDLLNQLSDYCFCRFKLSCIVRDDQADNHCIILLG
jgi:hypothetical protein